MKKLPKKCLTCAFMKFLDDELDILMCDVAFVYDNFSPTVQVEEDGICDHYELNEGLIEDAKLGMW